jgi:hypothetical protein
VRWGAAGFLLGAGFWIYLGVSELTAVDFPHPSPRQGLPGGPGSGCTSLALDRRNGRTTAAPCLGPARSLGDMLAAWLGEPLRP